MQTLNINSTSGKEKDAKFQAKVKRLTLLLHTENSKVFTVLCSEIFNCSTTEHILYIIDIPYLQCLIQRDLCDCVVR